eukprot:1332394-Amorphochlora_amoeboformis.AAC.1
MDTEAKTLSFTVARPSKDSKKESTLLVTKKAAFTDVASNFHIAVSLTTPGDCVELLDVTLPKPKVEAVRQK